MSDTTDHDPQPAPKHEGVDVIRDFIESHIYPGGGGHDEVWRNELAAKLEARRAFGITKYGQPLMSKDGRDTIKDIEDELLDAMVYIHKLAMSEDATPLATFESLCRMLELLDNLLAHCAITPDESTTSSTSDTP